MSRSGYIDDDCDDPLALGRWRGRVASAIRGKRGQAFLRELAAEMDAMPVKELIADELIDEDGQCCTIGVLCKSRGINVSEIDPTDYDSVAKLVGIAAPMAQEIEYENDECGDRFEQVDGQWKRVDETPAQRWTRIRQWVEKQLKKPVSATSRVTEV